jgi:putative peptidoglycan lipid II flippase
VVALAVMWAIAPWVVRILFERGAFTPSDTHAVTQILRLALWQLPFYFPALVFVAALAAQRGHARIALSGALNLVFKLPIALVLVHLYQLEGLVASTVVMYALSAALLYVLATRHQPT